MTSLIPIEKCSDPDSMHATSQPIALFFTPSEARKAVAASRNSYYLSVNNSALPVFYQVKDFLAWEKLNDPEYHTYLALKQRFEGVS